MGRRALAIFAVIVTGCSGDPPSTAEPPGEIIGRIEISADVPASNCRVLLEGSPLGAPCDGSGGFDIAGVIPGRWDLRVIDDSPTGLPSRRVAAAANSGFVTDLGAIRLAQPGSIGGRVIGATDGIVVLPAYGIVTAPNTNGGYLLMGVPPGVHDVVLITDDGTVVRGDVTVLPAKTTTQVDLDAAAAVDVATSIDGFALRASAGGNAHGGLTVELLDAATGDVATETTSEDDGAFVLTAGSGIYVLRARDGDSPITAIIPSVVPRGGLPMHMPSPLIVFPVGGDLDADGLDDDEDTDIDNDGVGNDDDDFPYDPAESQDVDDDGLGDRADLATQGSDVDTHNPTDDADADGLFDFEDVCPMDADPAQADGDGDGVGDVCDNCPLVPNEDQADSIGDGVGDVCRSCQGSEDCPLGATCQQGLCVECTSDSQCDGEVCRDGACVACTLTEACGGDLVCNVPVGECQECLVNLDCDAGSACVAGRCFAGCAIDADCGGAYCVDFACVACRNNADCPGTEWCDTGLCQPECSVDANCSGGRVCDLDTRTCVLPCDAGCPTNHSCDADDICRPTCDLSFPCAGGQVCDLVTNLCGPACTFDTDCTGFDECQLGECVPSGDCALDTDCPASQMCGVLGSCVARPTGFDVGFGAYTCGSACDCKLGETCNAGHCASDGVPTRFVHSGAPGDGLTMDTPTDDLTTALTGLVADDIVAVRAGQTITTIAVPTPITVPGVRLQGGYVMCSAHRWVRDGAQASRLQQDNANIGLLRVAGNFAAPATGVVIGGLTLTTTAINTSNVALDASFAPGLVVQRLTLELADSGGTTIGVRVGSSTGVLIEGIDVPGFHSTGGSGTLDGIVLTGSSGTIRDVTFGSVVDVQTLVGVRVTAVIGAVTVDGVSMAAWSTWGGADGVLIDAVPSFPVMVSNGQFVAMTASTANAFGVNTSAIHVRDSGNVTVSDSVVDGSGFIEPGNFGHWVRAGVWFENSAGAIDRVDVVMPQITSATYAIPFFIEGPEGDVTLTDCSASGAGGPNTHLISVQGVTGGTVVVDGGTFSSAQSGGTATAGLYASGSQFVVTDATFQVPGNATQVYGFYVISSAGGRIERSRFQAGGLSGVTSTSVGGYLASSANLELYDSWLVGGPAADSFTAGFWLAEPFTIRAIGNTIDGGGSPGQIGRSIGVMCEENSVPSVHFRSNLIDGGSASVHRMVENTNGDGGQCHLIDNWSFSYFAFRAAGVRDPSALEVADNIAGANANYIGDGVTCFDSAFPAPDFRIAAPSPCINTGSAGTRVDGTALTTDLLGFARVQGGTSDVGAQERQ